MKANDFPLRIAASSSGSAKLETDIGDAQKRGKELEAKVGAQFEHEERYQHLSDWWACSDSNREPKHYECSALTN